MENMNREEGTRKILTNYRRELNDPTFSARVMEAIAEEQFARMRRRQLLTWLLAVLTLELSVGLLLWTCGVGLADLANLPYTLLRGGMWLGKWLLENHYVILSLGVILLLKRIVEATTRYS